MIIKKWIKIAILAVEVLLIVLLITFGAVATKRGKTIKIKENRIEMLQARCDSLSNTISRLGAEDCISITCNVNIKAPNVFGQQNLHADAIAKTMATITRQELLNMKDSLNGVENKILE